MLANRLFTVLIQKEDDLFIAKCLENGVASQGKATDKAVGNLIETLELYYEEDESTSGHLLSI